MIGLGLGERRLAATSCRAIDAYEPAVVGDAVAAARGSCCRLQAIRDAEARTEVVRVGVEQSPQGNAPVNGPDAACERPATPPMKSGVASRLAIRPSISTYGMRQLVAKPEVERSASRSSASCPRRRRRTQRCRRCVVPPTCSVACCGRPSRKSAKSAPVCAGRAVRPLDEYRPVNVKLPRAFELISTARRVRRTVAAGTQEVVFRRRMQPRVARLSAGVAATVVERARERGEAGKRQVRHAQLSWDRVDAAARVAGCRPVLATFSV